MSGPVDGEVRREARRVLRRLMMPGARLVAAKDAYRLVVPARSGPKEVLRLAPPLVQAFVRRDWLAPTEGALVLSEAGLGWIRRALAPGDPFAAQHQLRAAREIAGPDGVVRTLAVNDGESPLGWLHRRRGPDGKPLISALQREAGERLRTDFTLAQMTPRLAADLAAPVVAGRRGAKHAPLPEIVLAAKQRFRLALNAVGPGLSDLLIAVCCHLVGLEDAERHNGWPRRSAKIVLQIALDRLAQHYGLVACGPVRGRLRTWNAPESPGQGSGKKARGSEKLQRGEEE